MPPLNSPLPAWREPFVWLVVGIPGLTVVAGLFTWWIAAQRADSNVAEDWYKQGLTINRSLAREARAEARELRAQISLLDNKTVSLDLRGRGELPTRITLALSHPVQAKADQRIVLSKQSDGRFLGTSLAGAVGTWTIALEAQDWRLIKRMALLRVGETMNLPDTPPARTGTD